MRVGAFTHLPGLLIAIPTPFATGRLKIPILVVSELSAKWVAELQ